VILGKGNFDALNYYQDLYRFDIASNSWSEINTNSMTFRDNNEYEVVNNTTYFTVRSLFGANSTTGKAIMKYNPTNYTFEEDYFICSSCSNEEFLLYNNTFYTAYKNGQNFGFRNLDNNSDQVSMGSIFSIGLPSRFVTDNTDIFFLGNVINTSLQTSGMYKLNPNILQ
jgi:hypothetical protein